jgi:hypothetical protein
MSADRAKQLLEEIKEERAKGGKIRLATTLIVLLVFGVFGLSTYNKIQGFDNEALLVELQEEAAKTVWPQVSKELDGVAQDAVPAIQEAMVAEAEALLPKLSEKLTTEAVVFQDNMNGRMKTSLDGELASQLEAREAEFKGKVPSFAEDDELYGELVERLQKNCQSWAMGQLDTTFQAHILVLQSINESVSTLMAKAGEERAEGEADVDLDYTLELFVEVFNSRVNEG